MTKYLDEERFIVQSNTSEAQKNYRDNYDRIFGDKPVYDCDECADTGCVVDPDADPKTVQTEGDLLKPCNLCGATDHERVTMANGMTLIGCSAVPQGMFIPEEVRVAAGPNVVLHIEPEGVDIGWLCPTCPPDGNEEPRRITGIDREEGYYECETKFAHQSDDTRRHDYRHKLA